MSYGEYRPPPGEPVIQYHVAGQPSQQYNTNTQAWQTPHPQLGEDAPATGFSYIHQQHIFDSGIFKDTIAPSLALHSGLSVIAWGLGRTYNYVEAKDVVWGSGMVINSWWSAIGRRLARGVSWTMIMRTLSWPERLLLTGTTLWGGRLTYRVVSRALRRGKDDPRYDEMKQEEGFWNQALLNTFLPEAVFQTLISLPFVAPFRHQGAVMSGYHPIGQSIAVGLFATGFAMETLADYQLDQHKSDGNTGLQRDGVWSIVRHPNYLGDALIHLSFPVLLFSSDMLAPIEILGPLANYVFLRYFGGDKQIEASQTRRYSQLAPEKMTQLDEYRTEKNSFWPSAQELQNQWLWIVVGAGGAGVVLERGVRALLH